MAKFSFGLADQLQRHHLHEHFFSLITGCLTAFPFLFFNLKTKSNTESGKGEIFSLEFLPSKIGNLSRTQTARNLVNYHQTQSGHGQISDFSFWAPKAWRQAGIIQKF